MSANSWKETAQTIGTYVRECAKKLESLEDKYVCLRKAKKKKCTNFGNGVGHLRRSRCRLYKDYTCCGGTPVCLVWCKGCKTQLQPKIYEGNMTGGPDFEELDLVLGPRL